MFGVGDYDGYVVFYNVGGYLSVNVERVELFCVVFKSLFGVLWYRLR